MQNYDFFDHLSSNYDEMISIEKSIINKKKYLRKYLGADYKSALDLGCGTGADSIALSQLGLKVTAVDQSNGMLKIAENNAKNYNVPIHFIKSDIPNLRLNEQKFDIIVSLGNTLANLTRNELQSLFAKLPELLNLNGKIIIQLINFHKLPSSGKYHLNKHTSESIEIIREYDIHKNDIDFIITRNDYIEGSLDRIVTKIYPHSQSFLETLTDTTNLKINFYGNLQMENFKKDSSENLVAVITK